MDKDYISKVAESKANYHKAKAKIPYEEKIKIIIALQKIDIEFHKSNPDAKSKYSNRKVWQLED